MRAGTRRALLADGMGQPSAFWDFTSGSLVDQVAGATLAFTRASSGWYFNASGLLVSAANDVPKFDYDPVSLQALGLRVELSRTSRGLHNRDMTQAAWTKTNATATKNQTGIDGVVNSCCALTATANNGTVLQSITNTSASRVIDVYLKRLVGVGTVELTYDNVTWTNITAALTGVGPNGFARVSIPTQTLANPVYGIRFGTNGDSVAADVFSLLDGALVTGPIVTGAAAVARALDVPIFSNVSAAPWFNQEEGTLIASCRAPEYGNVNNVAAIASFSDAGTTNRISAALSSAFSGQFQIFLAGVAQISVNVGTAAANGSDFVMGIAWKADNMNAAFNGVAGTPDFLGTIPTATMDMRVGLREGNAVPLNATIKSLAVYKRRMADAKLAARMF